MIKLSVNGNLTLIGLFPGGFAGIYLITINTQYGLWINAILNLIAVYSLSLNFPNQFWWEIYCLPFTVALTIISVIITLILDSRYLKWQKKVNTYHCGTRPIIYMEAYHRRIDGVFPRLSEISWGIVAAISKCSVAVCRAEKIIQDQSARNNGGVYN